MQASLVQEKRDPSRPWQVVAKRERAFRFHWHWHLEHELFLPGSAGECLVGAHAGLYRPGEAYLVGPRVPHLFRAERPQRAHVVFLDDGPWLDPWRAPALDRLLRRADRGLRLPAEHAGGVRAAVRALAAAEGLRGAAALFDLLAELAAAGRWIPLAAVDGRVPAEARGDPRFERALACLHERADDPDLDLAAIAARAGVGVPTLRRVFRRAAGRAVVAYLIEVRLGRVCRDLAETDRPVTAIAFARGFNTLSHFNRMFRARCGVTPRAYRSRFRVAGG